MIEIVGLTKQFGAFRAVDNLSLNVAPNQAVALWGHNGAGKTTVIKCLLGLVRYEGTIRVGGYDARSQGRATRAHVGYVPQELAFYDDMSTLESAHYFAALKRTNADRAPKVLADVGLADHMAKPVRALSGGMKQRLALGLALLADPPVLVLDEPTSSLDTAARSQFLGLLSEVKAAGKTILFTSHRMEEVEALADEVVVMEGGKAIARCPAHKLAEVVGLRSVVKLKLPLDKLDAAMQLLQAEGFNVRRNGVGVLVDVPPREKAAPIHSLSRANIPVHDFEVE